MSEELFVSNAALDSHMKSVGMGGACRSSEAPEVDLHEILAAKVRAGEPIYITGSLDGPVGHAHLATISRLRRETGLPVRVIFN